MRVNETAISRLYRDYLQTALAGRGGLNARQVACSLKRFDDAVSRGISPQQTFAHELENYGSEDTAKACASIQSELEKLNAEHQGIDINPVTKLRAYLDKHRANLAKCSAEISDGNGHSKTICGDPQAVKDPLFLPKRTQTFTHEAVGTFQGKAVKLELQIS